MDARIWAEDEEILGIGAGDGTRTRDIDLGKVALYQLSYSRPGAILIIWRRTHRCQRLGKGTLSRPGNQTRDRATASSSLREGRPTYTLSAGPISCTCGTDDRAPAIRSANSLLARQAFWPTSEEASSRPNWWTLSMDFLLYIGSREPEFGSGVLEPESGASRPFLCP